MAIFIKLPIKTVSEANQSEAWITRYRRKKAQQKEFAAEWHNLKAKVSLPCRVVFTRYASRLLDSDNLAGSFKFVRDALAREIGIDDGSPLIEFVYRQEKTAKREYFISVELQEI